MNWHPRIAIVGSCICEPEGEYEGRTLQIIWLGWVFEITLARWSPAEVES